MSPHGTSDRTAHVSRRVSLGAVVILVVVVAIGAYLYFRPQPWFAQLIHPVAGLNCGLTDEEVVQHAVVATGAITSTTAPDQADWGHIKICLDSMVVDRDRGEQDHPMLPVSHSGDDPTHLVVEQNDTASILPRHNIWWDDQPDKSTKGVHSARVMARVESRMGYNRLGFVPGNNYIVAWWRDTTVFMAVVNAQGAKRLGDPVPTFMPHGKVTGLAYDKTLDAPIPPNEVPLAGQHALDPMGGLSTAALECLKAHLKACFVDSKTEWRAMPAPGFGIGMPFRQGSSQPWMACAMYGCCCGGRQCHT